MPAQTMITSAPQQNPMATEAIDLGRAPERATAASDMALSGGPLARRDGHVVELTRYHQEGTVAIDGDTVTQQMGRGRSAEYSLGQLAAHSRDRESSPPRCNTQPSAAIP
jgi:hypothetical protein